MYGLAVAFTGETPAGAIGGVDTVEVAGGGIALSLLLVPAVFAVATFSSARENAPIWTLAGMGLLVAVGTPLLAIPPPNPAAGLIAGYAAGAVVTLSRPAGFPLRPRIIAAAVVVVVAFVGLAVVPAPTAWLAPALPFTAMGIADLFTEPVEDDA